MIAILLGVALAAPPDYKPTKAVSDCQLYLGPADGQGDVPMYAECTWPDVSLEKVDTVVGNWVGHKEVFSTVIETHEVRTDGKYTICHQTHRSSGISDRQVMLKMWRSELEGGGLRFEWTLSGDSPDLDKGNVAATRNDGWWEFRPREGGGVDVKYQLLYDPGGSVPGFLVRMFQTGGLADIVTEMRAAVSG